jgi:hypothetical protein
LVAAVFDVLAGTGEEEEEEVEAVVMVVAAVGVGLFGPFSALLLAALLPGGL